MGSAAAPSTDLADLLVELVDAGHAAARHRLVRARDQAAESGHLVQGMSPASPPSWVQFGLAMMPCGVGDRLGLTSDTTSGRPGPIRHAEELSITMAPAPARLRCKLPRRGGTSGEQCDVEARDVGGGGVLDRDLGSPHGSVVPADRADAKYRISSRGTSARRGFAASPIDLTCCAHNSDALVNNARDRCRRIRGG